VQQEEPVEKTIWEDMRPRDVRSITNRLRLSASRGSKARRRLVETGRSVFRFAWNCRAIFAGRSWQRYVAEAQLPALIAETLFVLGVLCELLGRPRCCRASRNRSSRRPGMGLPASSAAEASSVPPARSPTLGIALRPSPFSPKRFFLVCS